MPKISEAVREARREAILEATVSCLAELGYTGTNMRSIAERAGLTKGGLYAYFDSREAVLLEIARRYMEHQLADFSPRPGESAREQFERILTRYEQPADPDTVRVRRAIIDLWSFAGEIPTVRAELERRYQRYLSTLADVVRRGQREGAFRREADPTHVAGLLLAARDGMMFEGLKLGLPVPVLQLTQLLRRLVTDYLTAAAKPKRGRP